MGKATKWFRSVLGLKKQDPPPLPSLQQLESVSRSKEKRRWSFVKSSTREKEYNLQQHAKPTALTGKGEDSALAEYLDEDPSKHAIAVAAATAAVAEAAVAAAQAAAEVVRLTRSGRCVGNPAAAYVGQGGDEFLDPDLAAVRIQSVFRGYLARRALRALKALVKLQALVRGHIERKRTADWFHRMQALLRAQARARTGRSQISEPFHSSSKSSLFHQPGPATPEKFEKVIRARSGKYEQSSTLKRMGSRSNGRAFGEQDAAQLYSNWSEHQLDGRIRDQRVPSARAAVFVDDEKSDKILEIDTGKPRVTPKRRNLFHSSHHATSSDPYSHSFTTSKDSRTHLTAPSPSSGEVQSFSPLKFSYELEEVFCTAENSPQLYSASSRGGVSKRSPFTPTKSDGSRSFLSGYSDYPNYMSNTESSKAKLRSLSAPRQRPQYERSSSAKRYSLFGFGEPRSNSTQRASTLRSSFTSKAYPGSGRLDRLGIPVEHSY